MFPRRNTFTVLALDYNALFKQRLPTTKTIIFELRLLEIEKIPYVGAFESTQIVITVAITI